MKFKISQELDINSSSKSHLIEKLSVKIETFLRNKNYGEDIKTIFIGLVVVKTREGLENIFKERKPKYIDFKLMKNRLTGESMEIDKEYSYDIKFDYELYDQFVEFSDKQSEKLLIQKLLESLKHFDNLPKQVEDFDVKRFKEDLSNYLVTDLDSL